MNQKVGIAESGMATAEISVARQSRRNRKHHEHGEHRALDQRLHRRMILGLGIFDAGIEQLGNGPSDFPARAAGAPSPPSKTVTSDAPFAALEAEAQHLAPVHHPNVALLGIEIAHLGDVG